MENCNVFLLKLKYSRLAVVLMFFWGVINLYAQTPGQIDSSFNHQDKGSFSYFGDIFGADGFDGSAAKQREVYCMALQSDGKILVGGSFQKYNLENKKYLVRLYPDGTLDTTFIPDLSVINKDVYAIVVLSDGKILVGGYFNNAGNRYIVRLNEDGSIDNSFLSSKSDLTNHQNVDHANGVQSIALQPDGKILAGGIFSTQGVSYRHITRLNADGSRDTSFNLGTVSVSIVNGIRAMNIQSDGKILVSASVYNQDGITQKGILRLNTDGSLDADFNPAGDGINSGEIQSISLVSNGKIMISGFFSEYNGTARNKIARINADGSLDASFKPAGTGPDGSVRAIQTLSDGKMLVAGEFFKFNNQYYNYIARLHANGSLDASFNPINNVEGGGANNKIFTMLQQPDGMVLIGGDFMNYNRMARKRIARIHPDGVLDITFNPGTGANSEIQSLALQPDGKIVVGGFFTIFNKEKRHSIARLNPDGTLDESFVPDLDRTLFNPSSGGLRAIAIQADGKILIGGTFHKNGEAFALARLHTDGSWDSSFQAITGQGGDVKNIIIEPDGKILVAGGAVYNGNEAVRGGVYRLNNDGSVHASFVPTSSSWRVWWLYGAKVLAMQPDRKLLIGGNFFRRAGESDNPPHTGLARLNADESIDASFNPGGAGTDHNGTKGSVYKVVLQPDGKILIAGIFKLYNNSPANRIARLNSDGTLDATFHNPVMEDASYINDLIVQKDGKIIAVGYFDSYDGTDSKNIVRLNQDGTVDPSFDSGMGTTAPILALVLQQDGKIVIGGSFISYNGIGKNRLVRIYGDDELVLSVGQIGKAGVLVQNDEMADLSLYPNPVKDYLEVFSTNEFIQKIIVFDLTGAKVLESSYNGQEGLINLSQLKAAVYILNIVTQKGNRIVKIVKE